MRKAEARKMFRQKRIELTDVQQAMWDDLILIQLQKLALPFLTRVLSFVPADNKKEIDTLPLTDYLSFANPGLQIAYPVVGEAHAMKAVVPNREDEFVLSKYGIPEPAGGAELAPDEIDLVLVPLLAFDEKGHRAGYGKGYYDRFLMQCRSDCIKLGVSYFEALPQLTDADEFDIPLDLCITPQKAYVF